MKKSNEQSPAEHGDEKSHGIAPCEEGRAIIVAPGDQFCDAAIIVCTHGHLHDGASGADWAHYSDWLADGIIDAEGADPHIERDRLSAEIMAALRGGA